jgi:TDG/mug DNA glycosylase family protein
MPQDPALATLRLEDRIEPGVRVLFVGINPGVRSAVTRHHFAGFSNRFWKLLSQSGLVPEPITFESDHRLPEFGFGMTNLVARPTPGINDLERAEYVDGWKTLEEKIRRYRPEIVALVGVTLYRAIEPLLAGEVDRKTRAAMRSRPIALGPQPATVHGARIFVLPNPSGRNANYSYAEMLAAFTLLAEGIGDSNKGQGKGCVMSSKNGDKSRYQVNRKRAVHRRAKIRELVKTMKAGPSQPAKAAK